jgi:hypothetical protein
MLTLVNIVMHCQVPERAGNFLTSHVRWVPCHHGMERPQVADGGIGLQIRRVASNILNKQSRTADKVWPSSFGVGLGANNSSP